MVEAKVFREVVFQELVTTVLKHSIYIISIYRNSACALCSRGESFSYSGAGLPYDSSEHDSSRSH